MHKNKQNDRMQMKQNILEKDMVKERTLQKIQMDESREKSISGRNTLRTTLKRMPNQRTIVHTWILILKFSRLSSTDYL